MDRDLLATYLKEYNILSHDAMSMEAFEKNIKATIPA